MQELLDDVLPKNTVCFEVAAVREAGCSVYKFTAASSWLPVLSSKVTEDTKGSNDNRV